MAIKCIFPSAADGAQLIAWLRDANTGETERSVEFSNIEGGVEPGNGYWDAGTSSVKLGAMAYSTLPTTAEVNAYFNRVVDHMRTGWIMSSNSEITNTATPKTRWLNCRYWIGSLHAVVVAVMADTTLTDAQKQFCWDAARALCPDDPAQIAFWYRNHTIVAWTPFSTNFHMSQKAAYVGFRYTDTTLPMFASDAGAGVTWGGAAGTLAVMVSADWNGA